VSEAGYVELPIIQWLSGQGSPTPGDTGLGWVYRDEAAMVAFNRPLEDPLVEKLLVQAIRRINPEVKTEAQARLAISALRKTMSHPDRLTANRETLDLLRDGAAVDLVPGEPAKTVRFIELDPARQHLNDFTATNQYRVQGVRQCRDDTVLLVNGIPLVIAEYKSYITSGKDWKEAVHQLHRYQRQAPLMLTPNVFCVAADEDEFRFGRYCSTMRARTTSSGISIPGGHGAASTLTIKAGGTSRRRTASTTRWRCPSRDCCAWRPVMCWTFCSTSWCSRRRRARPSRRSPATSSSRR
jgi:type I site-specific restriction-modification system R (restriction) subunit